MYLEERISFVFISLCIAVMLVISGCSIESSSSYYYADTPSSSTEAASPATTSTAGIVQRRNILPTSSAPTAAPTIEIPVTWADLKLTGRLVFTSADTQQEGVIMRIQVLDLETGRITTLFQTTGRSWLYYMTASSVTGQVVISYAPPLGYNSPAQQALYIFSLDKSRGSQLLFDPPALDDQYLQAEWSPDGRYIYYVHSSNKPQYQGQLYPVYEIYRIAYLGGRTQKIAENAFWPRLSPDSSRLAYVSSDPTDGRNKLFVANADGSDAHQVVLTGRNPPEIIDAPIFSSDGQSLLFSAPTPLQSYQPNWLEKLFGVQVAEAHVIPSDWWSVPLKGGIAQQLTHIQSSVLFASVSPDGRYIASYSGNGLFVMRPDGSGLTVIIPDLGGMVGMVNWIP